LTHRSRVLENQKRLVNFQLPFVGVDNNETNDNDDIHVYPFKTGHNEDSPSSTISESSESMALALVCDDEDANKVKVNTYKTSLEPDPILQIKKIIGFGSIDHVNYTNCVRWSRDCQYLIYGCQAIVVAVQIATMEQSCFVGHADRVSCIALTPDNSKLL
jgi:hypothetical protein